MELVWANAVHRGNDAAEDMVAAFIFPGFLDGDDIAGVGYDAKGMFVATGGTADFTDGIGGEMKTDRAKPYLLLGFN